MRQRRGRNSPAFEGSVIRLSQFQSQIFQSGGKRSRDHGPWNQEPGQLLLPDWWRGELPWRRELPERSESKIREGRQKLLLGARGGRRCMQSETRMRKIATPRSYQHTIDWRSHRKSNKLAVFRQPCVLLPPWQTITARLEAKGRIFQHQPTVIKPRPIDGTPVGGFPDGRRHHGGI